MADLASTAVNVLEVWTEGGLNGRRNVAKRVTLTLTGQGGTSNKITAEALGFLRVTECGNAVNAAENLVFVAVPSVDGGEVLLVPAMQTAQAPGDVTGTVTLTIKGVV